MGVEVTDHEAAAVEERDGGERAGSRGPVDARRQVSGRTRDGGVVDGPDRHDVLGLPEVHGELAERGASLHGRLLVHRDAGLDELDQAGELRVEWHPVSVPETSDGPTRGPRSARPGRA